MRTVKITLVLSIFFILLIQPGYAQSKIGWVNSKTIMDKLPEAQDAQRQIDNLVAQWQSEGGPDVKQGGKMKVVTTHLRAGYYWKNGMPYSANAVMTEYFRRVTLPGGEVLLIVTIVVEDPTYLAGPYIRSANFRKLPDASGWNPTPCSAR